MNNVIPFLAPTKISDMVNAALAHQQVKATKPRSFFSNRMVWSGGTAMAACLALFLLLSPAQIPDSASALSEKAATASITTEDDMNEFSEMVMLETWERY